MSIYLKKNKNWHTLEYISKPIYNLSQYVNIILPEKSQSKVLFLLWFLLKLFSNNLFLSLHVLTKSDFFFNNWLLSNNLTINSFSVRHLLQQSIWLDIWLLLRFPMKSWVPCLNLLIARCIWTIRCYFCIWNN